MKILMLSIDQKVFDPESPVRARMERYAASLDALHVIVHTPLGYMSERIGENLYLYPTNTRFRVLYFFRSFVLARRLIRQKNVNLVVAQYVYTALLGVFLKVVCHVPLEVQIHGDIQHVPWIHRVLYRLSVNCADVVRTVSEKTKGYLMTQWGISEEKIVVLPIFVDVTKYRSAQPRFDLHQKYPQFEKIILMLSRFEPEKRIEHGIHVLPEVLKKYPKAGLIIVGEGSRRSYLEQVTRDLGFQANVVFEPWTNDPLSYYKTADVFLVTSEYEGYGMTIIEALASGLPVVSTDVGVAREAGADVVEMNALGPALLARLEKGKRDVALTHYPYKDEDEYVRALKEVWETIAL